MIRQEDRLIPDISLGQIIVSTVICLFFLAFAFEIKAQGQILNKPDSGIKIYNNGAPGTILIKPDSGIRIYNNEAPAILNKPDSGILIADIEDKISKGKNNSSKFVVYGSKEGEEPYVRIYSENDNFLYNFFAYDKNFRGGVNVALGDVDGNGIDEIITGARKGGGPHVRIFKKDGTLKYPGFFAYNSNFRGGVNVASGDLDGDGIDEIVTGVGRDGEPQVRIFDQSGNQKLNPGFYAYNKNFRGGISVACGDIDYDGKEEIITGAGEGGGPQVRVFEANSSPKPIQFFAFESSYNKGINVYAVDKDNDGKSEIAVEGKNKIKVYRYNEEKVVVGEYKNR